MPNTYFVDIDGTILYQPEDFSLTMDSSTLVTLPDAKYKLMKWHCEGHHIILVTGRPESMRLLTEKHLRNSGIVYDRLVMGVGSGPRVLINDYVDSPKAIAHNVLRNKDGLAFIKD